MKDKTQIIVSVCMITYNHENYIREAIEGVLMQKCNFPIELIIGEDNSTDDTAQIIQDYAIQFSDLIKVRHNKPNIGMMSNFIKTLDECTGNYIALCEGDDYWTDPYKLQKQVDFLETNPEYSMCFTSAKKYYQNTDIIKNWHIELKQKEYSAAEIISNLLVPTCTAVFRNSKNNYFQRISGNKKFIFGDMILWLSLLEEGKNFCLPFETAVYRRNESSVTATMPLELQLKLLEQHEEIAIGFDGKYKEIENKLLSRQYLIVSLKLLNKKDLRYKEYFKKSVRKSVFYLPMNILYAINKFLKKDFTL